MRVYVVRKWPFRGRSRFVCWNITRVKSVVNVQRAFCAKYAMDPPTDKPRDLADLKARIIAAVKNIDKFILTCVCGKNLNIVSLCAVSPVVHILYRCVPCHPWCTYCIVVCRVTRGAHIVSLCAVSPVVHISYRCVPCHPWCTHRTSPVVKKKTFSFFLWL